MRPAAGGARAAAAALAAGLLAGAGAAGAFVRSEGSRGVCLSWPARSPAWQVNPARAGAVPGCDEATLVASVAASFAPWTQATRAGAAAPCTDLELPYGGTSAETVAGFIPGGSNGNLVVFRRGACSAQLAADDPCWRAGTCANEHGCWPDDTASDRNVLALTTTTYDTRSGAIVDADVEFNDWDGVTGGGFQNQPTKGWYFTCANGPAVCSSYGQSGCVGLDLRNVLTHEVGHFVGLGHSTVQESTMYASAGVGEVRKRDLAADDVAGVCTVYPVGAATPACSTTGNDDGGGCGGCGGGAGGPLALGLAALALLARPRRRVV